MLLVVTAVGGALLTTWTIPTAAKKPTMTALAGPNVIALVLNILASRRRLGRNRLESTWA
jgi:hypothetical protein